MTVMVAVLSAIVSRAAADRRNIETHVPDDDSSGLTASYPCGIPPLQRESDAMINCNVCGKSMKNDLAMKIHMGRMHKSKVRKKANPRSPGTDLTSVSTSALLAELRRRADIYDRLKALTL